MKNKSKLWIIHQDNERVRLAIKNGAIKQGQIQQGITDLLQLSSDEYKRTTYNEYINEVRQFTQPHSQQLSNYINKDNPEQPKYGNTD